MSSRCVGPKAVSVSQPKSIDGSPDLPVARVAAVPDGQTVYAPIGPRHCTITPLRKRADFVRLRKAPGGNTSAFVLTGAPQPAQTVATAQSHDLPEDEQLDCARIGLTVTKKMGNAVKRNRIKRRLRAAVTIVAPSVARPQHDYVLIAKPAALERRFEDLVGDLRGAFVRLHGKLDGNTDSAHRSRGSKSARRRSCGHQADRPQGAN